MLWVSGYGRWAAVLRAVKDRQWFHLKSSHPVFAIFNPLGIQCMVREMRVLLLGVFRVLWCHLRLWSMGYRAAWFNRSI